MVDPDNDAFYSLIKALSDLAKGQKEVLEAINRLADRPGTIKTVIEIMVEEDPMREMEVMCMHTPHAESFTPLQ